MTSPMTLAHTRTQVTALDFARGATVFDGSGNPERALMSDLQRLLLGNAQSLDKTADYTVLAADVGRLLRGDATAGALAFTLAATAAAGDRVFLRKSDSSANRVTVKNNGGTEIAWLSAQYDEAWFKWSGSAWVPELWNIAPVTVTFTASGTLTKAPLARFAECVAIGGGGAGGSGARRATGGIRTGGTGGLPGSIVRAILPASSFGATETVTIGASQAGPAAVGADTTNGTAGTAGNDTSVGAVIVAKGGPGGSAGAASNAAAPTPLWQGTVGRAGTTPASSSSAAVANGDHGVAPGAGTGGSMDAANVVRAPGAGGSAYGVDGVPIAGGAAGTSGSKPGGAGTAISDTVRQWCGSAGGGGYPGSAAAAGAGGDGAAPGAPGGGGGSSDNGNASGAGGAGARGEYRHVWRFH